MATPCCVPEHSSALPWALDSVFHNPGKQPSCHSSNLLRYLRSIDWAQIIQSRVCCLLDTTSTRPASTSTSASGCSMSRRRGRSGVTLLVSNKRTADFHSQVNCTSKVVLAKRDFALSLASQLKSQDVLIKCTSGFHSQVNCTSKIVLAKRNF